MKSFFYLLIFILPVFLQQKSAHAQVKVIHIAGRAIDAVSGQPIINLQIINKITRSRYFGDTTGRFTITAMKSDSLFITATGYSSRFICFKDSLYLEKYQIMIRLNKIQVELPNVNVQSQREFDQIQRDAQRLGYDQKDYQLHGGALMVSPITAIYQRTSRREKDKRGYAELMNQVHQRELLREILQKYIDLEVIRLSDEEIGPFLDFCNVPESFLKKGLEYDIANYLKSRYPEFIRQKKLH